MAQEDSSDCSIPEEIDSDRDSSEYLPDTNDAGVTGTEGAQSQQRGTLQTYHGTAPSLEFQNTGSTKVEFNRRLYNDDYSAGQAGLLEDSSDR